MSVCPLSEGECGNAYPLCLQIRISVVYSMYTSALLFLCLQSLCALDHSLMHVSVAQDRLEKRRCSPTFNHTFTYPSFMVAEQRCSTTSAEMAEYLQVVGEQPSELLVEE